MGEKAIQRAEQSLAKLTKERETIYTAMAKNEQRYRREHERLMGKERKLRDRIDKASARLNKERAKG